MEGKLDFSLPELSSKRSVRQTGLVILLLIAIALGATSVYLLLRQGSPQPAAVMVEPGLSLDQAKELATKLSERNLYHQAAAVWQEALRHSKPTDNERAKALFQVGLLLEKAEDYGPAVEYFYRSEMVAPLDELSHSISTHVQNCFERMGKFSALRYELMDRTEYHPSDANKTAVVVAEIGPEKITETDLGGLIEQAIDNQLEHMASFLSPDQLKEQKQRMLDQLKTSQARQKFLTQWLGQELLYREALASKLDQKPEVKRLLDDNTRSLLAQQLMTDQLASKIHITDSDVNNYYAANQSKYMQPAQVHIRHIRVADEQKAKDVIARLNDGDDFVQLAKDMSQDDATKDKGGQIETAVTPGDYVPSMGENKAMNGAIFAVQAPAVLQHPFQTDKGWEIIKVDSKTSERQKSLDEVQQQVLQDLTQEKQQAVQQEFLQQMMDKYHAVIHTAAFGKSEK